MIILDNILKQQEIHYLLNMYIYLSMFPGLVHFLYVNRNSHRLKAPSFQITGDQDTNSKQMALIKKNVSFLSLVYFYALYFMHSR